MDPPLPSLKARSNSEDQNNIDRSFTANALPMKLSWAHLQTALCL